MRLMLAIAMLPGLALADEFGTTNPKS